MPAPSTPEAQKLHREAQTLIEQAAVQQAESSVSYIRQQGSTQVDGGAQGRKRLFTQAARRDNRPTRVERLSGSESLMRTDRPKMATHATSSTSVERATRRRGRR
jgi:hypothetical protein